MCEFFKTYRWCTSESKAWRFRVKLMLLIPAVLLPITIVCIALSRFQATAKVSESQTFPTYGMQDEPKIEDISWCKFYGHKYIIIVINAEGKLRISIIAYNQKFAIFIYTIIRYNYMIKSNLF